MAATRQYQDEIRRLKKERGIVILAHNYQIPEIQEVADYVGDSLGLCRQAQESDTKTILFCGVNFMAETAAIMNPTKRVLIPDPKARCPMAAQLPARLVREAKVRHPGIPVVLYVNTLAEAKAEADITCTSSNVCKIIQSLESDTVLFGPDANLAVYAKNNCNCNIIPIPKNGFCHVHVRFSYEPKVYQFREKYPDAKFLAHPECGWGIQQQADFVGSTEQMIQYARSSASNTLVVATEVGLVTRMQREIPNKKFVPAIKEAVCKAMKKNTLEKVKTSLLEDKYLVTVPKSIAKRARRSIQRMLRVT